MNIKPNYNQIIVARKPINRSVLENIEKYGVGGINIDSCRIPLQCEDFKDLRVIHRSGNLSSGPFNSTNCGLTKSDNVSVLKQNGRFPSNVILTYNKEDEQEVCSGFPYNDNPNGSITNPNLNNALGKSGIYGKYSDKVQLWESYQDSGSASRYFKNCNYGYKDIEKFSEVGTIMNEKIKLINGNMLKELDKLEENSVDAIVTDPPYELNFMGKGWDNAGVSFQKETWEKCLRVLKPGGHLLAFGGSRTFHRIAVAIEDAGFEIRDTIMWLYGSRLP